MLNGLYKKLIKEQIESGKSPVLMGDQVRHLVDNDWDYRYLGVLYDIELTSGTSCLAKLRTVKPVLHSSSESSMPTWVNQPITVPVLVNLKDLIYSYDWHDRKATFDFIETLLDGKETANPDPTD